MPFTPQDSDHSTISFLAGNIPVPVASQNLQGPFGFRVNKDKLKWDGPSIFEYSDEDAARELQRITKITARDDALALVKLYRESLEPNISPENFNKLIAKFTKIMNTNGFPQKPDDDYYPVEQPGHYEARINRFFEPRTHQGAKIICIQEKPEAKHKEYSTIFDTAADKAGFKISQPSYRQRKNPQTNQTEKIAHTSVVLYRKSLQNVDTTTNTFPPAIQRILLAQRLSIIRYNGIAYISGHLPMSAWSEEQFTKHNHKDITRCQKTLINFQTLFTYIPDVTEVVLAGDFNIPLKQRHTIEQQLCAPPLNAKIHLQETRRTSHPKDTKTLDCVLGTKDVKLTIRPERGIDSSQFESKDGPAHVGLFSNKQAFQAATQQSQPPVERAVLQAMAAIQTACSSLSGAEQNIFWSEIQSLAATRVSAAARMNNSSNS